LEPFSLDREVSLKRRSASMAETKQRGAVMVAFILGFIYQHSCRKYLAAVRTYNGGGHKRPACFFRWR
jgi:hypothetical protein